MAINEKPDLISNILMISILVLGILWIFIDLNELLLFGAIIALLVVFIYTKRISQISRESQTPFSDTLMALSGVNISLHLSGLYFDFPALLVTVPMYSVYLLLLGAVFKMFLIDRVLVEFLRQINNGFFYLIDWSKNKFINLLRIILTLSSAVLFLISGVIQDSIPSVYSISIAFLLLAIVVLISSMNRWEGKYRTIRLIVFIVAIILLLSKSNIDSLEIKLSSRLFISSFLIWAVSIPQLTYYFQVIGNKLVSFVSDKFLLLLRLISFILSWIALFALNDPINLVVFAILLIFSLWEYITPLLKNFYFSLIYNLKSIYNFAVQNFIPFLRMLSGITGVVALIASIWIKDLYLNPIGIMLLAFAFYTQIQSFFISLKEIIVGFWKYLESLVKYTYKWIVNNPFKAFRRISGLVSIVLWILYLLNPTKIYLYGGIGFLFIAISITVLNALKWLYNQFLSFVNWLGETSKFLINWITHNLYTFSRIISAALGIYSFIYASQAGNSFYYVIPVVLLVYTFLPQLQSIVISIFEFVKSIVLYVKYRIKRLLARIITMLHWINENKYMTTRIISAIIAIAIFITNFWLQDPYIPWVSLALLLYTFAPSLYKILKDTVLFVKMHPKGSLQISSFTLAFISYNYAPSTQFVGISMNKGLMYLFLLLGSSPWLWNIIKTIMPSLNRFFHLILRNLTSIDRIIPFVATLMFFIPNYTDFSNNMYIGLYIVIALMYAVSFNYWILRITDSLVMALYTILFSVFKVIKNILRFFRFIGFWSFLKRFFVGLVRRIIELGKMIYRNIIIILLYLLAFAFILFGVGVIFPGIFPPASPISSAVGGNFIISIIVAGVLGLIGVMTFREVFERRSKLQLEVAK